MAAKKILIVDDEAAVRRLLRNCLESDGFVVEEAQGRVRALERIARGGVALVTLDVNLDGENGFDIARDIRREHEIPIIMVTGRTDVIDRVAGLELGADDYITKPFHVREVIARVRSVLRRAEKADTGAAVSAGEGEGGVLYRFAGMCADPKRMELTGPEGDVVDLTAGDFRLLLVFLRSKGRILSRDAIMDLLHGQAWSPLDRTIDNQVARLRKKVETDPARPRLIKTVRGIGYTFAEDVVTEVA